MEIRKFHDRVPRESSPPKAGASLELRLGQVAEEATDWKVILPMMAASVAYQGIRSAALSRWVRHGTRFWSQSPLSPRLASSLLAFGPEVGVFTGLNRSFRQLEGKPSGMGLGQELLSAGLTLGTLKLFGHAGRQVLGNPQLRRNLFPFKSQKAQGTLDLVFPQAAVFTGLWTAHRLEERLGLRPYVDNAALLTHTLASLFSLGMGIHLGQRVLGRGFQSLQGDLEIRSRQYESQWSRPKFSELWPKFSIFDTSEISLEGPGGIRIRYPGSVGIFLSEKGGGSFPRHSRKVSSEEMVKALEESEGNLSQAARLLKIPKATLRHDLLREGRQAAEGSPLRQWAERISPEGRRRSQREHWQRIVAALREGKGNVALAAERLGMPRTTLESQLNSIRAQDPEYQEVAKWAARLSPRGRRHAKVRFWLQMARSLSAMRGNIRAAAKALGISDSHFHREMDQALASRTISRLESPIRSKFLATLARWKPEDPRLSRALGEEPDPAVRLAIVQNIFSTRSGAEALLLDRIQNEGSEVLSTAASHALQRTPYEKILAILSGDGRTFSAREVAASMDISSHGARELLMEMVQKGWIVGKGSDAFALTPKGKETSEHKWREDLWDLLDAALEETGGHQGMAAPLLGISRHTMHKYLAASLGRVNLSTIQSGQHYYGPEFLAPLDHPIRRWSHQSHLEELKARRRIKKFSAHWERIARTLEATVGNMTAAGRFLGISESSVRKHIRLAAGLAQEPLARWGDPDYVQSRQEEARQAEWERIRQEREIYLKEASPYRDIPTHGLVQGKPEAVPESIRRELLTRFSVGDRKAGQELLRLYEAWILKESKSRRPEEIPLEDMIQAGRMGLLQAAFRHDPERGATFLSYAKFFILKEHVALIRSYMDAYMTRDDYQLMRAIHTLQNQAALQGDSLTLDALAAQLEVTRDKVEQIRMAERTRHTQSLDREGDSEGRSLHEVIPGETGDGDQLRLRLNFINVVREFLKRHRREGDALIPPEFLLEEGQEDLALAERFGLPLDQVQEQRTELRKALQAHLREQGIEEDYFE